MEYYEFFNRNKYYEGLYLNNTKIDDSQKADMIQSMIDEKLLSQIAKNNNIQIRFFSELKIYTTSFDSSSLKTYSSQLMNPSPDSDILI